MALNWWRRRREKKELGKFLSAVRNLRHAEDDLLDDARKRALDALIAEGEAVPPENAAAFVAGGRDRVDGIVPPPRCRKLREWLDILAVVGAVAFGIRGLYTQPFKIPTGSMQPTLYGIHFIEREGKSNPLLGKTTPVGDYLLFTARRARLELRQPGVLEEFSTVPGGNFLFDHTKFRVGGVAYSLPGAPSKVFEYSRLLPERRYPEGAVLCDGYLSLGDHLFVDRISHYLTGLRRGDIVIFNTGGLSVGGRPLCDISGFYYIKRLVGLPGDTLKISDRQLWVKPRGAAEFRKIQELDSRFTRLYSGQGGYQGHTADMDGTPGPFLGSGELEYTVPEDSYFMMGDNTRFSLDSRAWGAVPRRNIVGRAAVIFWPFSRRWGIVDRAPALAVPTGEPASQTYPSMYLQ